MALINYNFVLITLCSGFVGVSPSGKASVFGTDIRGFESLHPIHFFDDRGIEQFGSSSGS